MDIQRMIEANEANWDARTPIHLASRFYDVTTRDPDQWFAPHEWPDLGDLDGKDVAHLQCHIGAETLAFAKRGARTTGLDFSTESIRAARDIATRAGLPVHYVKADVHDAADALGRESFDIVYTGKGALLFLPDLDAWAHQVAALLRPGGRLYLVEFHPLLHSLGAIPDGTDNLTPTRDYLPGRGPEPMDGTHTYTDGPTLDHAREYYEWAHSVGEIVTALVTAGLHIDLLRETDQLPWQRWPTMTTRDGVWHRLPDSAPKLPLLLTVGASKP